MARRGGPRIPRFAYLCPRRARRARGFRPPDEGPDTHPRNGDPMSARRPYERFRRSREAPARRPRPGHVPGIAPFAGAHTLRHPGDTAPRNGYPMTGFGRSRRWSLRARPFRRERGGQRSPRSGGRKPLRDPPPIRNTLWRVSHARIRRTRAGAG